MSLLKRLQAKPKHKKSQYAFLGACVATGIIGVFWVSALPVRLSEMNPKADTEEVSGTDFGEILSETKNQLGNIIDWNTETVEPEPAFPANSALGALSAGEDTMPPQEDVVESPEEAVVLPQSRKEEGQKPMVSQSPRVILIATTTNQKSE